MKYDFLTSDNLSFYHTIMESENNSPLKVDKELEVLDKYIHTSLAYIHAYKLRIGIDKIMYEMGFIKTVQDFKDKVKESLNKIVLEIKEVQETINIFQHKPFGVFQKPERIIQKFERKLRQELNDIASLINFQEFGEYMYLRNRKDETH